MAGKLVPVKHNPVSLLSHRIYVNDHEFKKVLMTAHDPKSKSEHYTLPQTFANWVIHGSGYPTADGEVNRLISESNYRSLMKYFQIRKCLSTRNEYF
jgi:hypothetical protein